MADILAITFIFGGGSLFLLAISPVGRAIAERIRRRGDGSAREAVDKLRESQAAIVEELDALRQELTEVQERLDFTERALVQARERARLPEA